jgi:RHS repeat-associated protein
MTWTLAGNQIGDLEYSYDAAGHVIEKAGSMADTNLPQAVTGNTFNADNEMTSFNGTAMAYDANGNLTNDGTNTYAWDARNHLSAIAGPVAASFVYGPFGRRMSKSINGTATSFLYDGLNPVQELQNGSPSANMLTGLGIDEYFQRTDSSGASDLLTDALGSTLALADSSGAMQTSYTYDPFGNTTASGASSTNPYQFTEREKDGTGLYFNRARYYSPAMQRFASQDPIGFAGGDANLYAYGSNDPIDLIDPLGLDAYLCDRPLDFKHAPPEIGPFYHQFICVVQGGSTQCFGLTTYNGSLDAPESILNSVPGSFEPDKPNKSCTRVSKKRCVDKCLLDLRKLPPPNYNLINLFGGMNCHQFSFAAVVICQAQCADSAQ